MANPKKTSNDIIPKIKKKISSFARGEKGKISKQSMLTVGSIVGGAALGAVIASKIAEGAGTRTPGGKPMGQLPKVVRVGEDTFCEVYSQTNEVICSHSHHASY